MLGTALKHGADVLAGHRLQQAGFGKIVQATAKDVGMQQLEVVS